MKNVLVLGVVALALVGCAKKEEAPAPATTADPCANVVLPSQPDANAPIPADAVPAECLKKNADTATPADPCANLSSGNPAAEPSAECVASKEAAAKKDL